MTHRIKAPLLLVVTNLAHNCEVFCRASACPWFSTSLAEKHPNPKGKGCFTPHHPCRWAEGKAIGGGSTQARGSAQRLTRLLREGKERKKAPPPSFTSWVPRAACSHKNHCSAPTASALEVTRLQLPQSPSVPRIKALPFGRVSGSHATELSCSSPGKRFHFLITPEPPPQSFPQQMWLKLHIFLTSSK